MKRPSVICRCEVGSAQMRPAFVSGWEIVSHQKDLSKDHHGANLQVDHGGSLRNESNPGKCERRNVELSTLQMSRRTHESFGLFLDLSMAARRLFL